MNYQIKRSKRKTIQLSITPEGLLVRAPLQATDADIEKVVQENRDWVRRHQEKVAREVSEAQAEGMLSMEDIRQLADQALEYIPKRVAYYAPLVGVAPGRITIRNQKTRWGSCSRKGNLNFNCLLMLTPPEVIDSIVVHELCHMKQMNHSRAFYDEVYRVYPDYDKWHRWLREHGGAIMIRAGY